MREQTINLLNSFLPNPKNKPIHIELMTCDWKSLKRILEYTAQGSELPLYEHEYQALQRLLTKIAEQDFVKEDNQ